MKVSSLEEETVSLIPENFTLVQPEDMTLFRITGSSLRKTSNSKTGVQMKITLKRRNKPIKVQKQFYKERKKMRSIFPSKRSRCR